MSAGSCDRCGALALGRFCWRCGVPLAGARQPVGDNRSAWLSVFSSSAFAHDLFGVAQRIIPGRRVQRAVLPALVALAASLLCFMFPIVGAAMTIVGLLLVATRTAQGVPPT